MKREKVSCVFASSFQSQKKETEFGLLKVERKKAFWYFQNGPKSLSRCLSVDSV
eukprot:UN07079